MINWKVRIKNKAFWSAIIPAIFLVVQAVANVFGYTLELSDLGNKLLLVIAGIVTDPTTQGVSDSSRALSYTEPK
ncbi:phage holin [Streptococcus agalactiae]